MTSINCKASFLPPIYSRLHFDSVSLSLSRLMSSFNGFYQINQHILNTFYSISISCFLTVFNILLLLCSFPIRFPSDMSILLYCRWHSLRVLKYPSSYYQHVTPARNDTLNWWILLPHSVSSTRCIRCWRYCRGHFWCGWFLFSITHHLFHLLYFHFHSYNTIYIFIYSVRYIEYDDVKNYSLMYQ